MIQTDAGYEGTRNALAILERSLASSTRRRAGDVNFHFDIEPVVEEILKLRAMIDEYSGLTAFLQKYGPPPPCDDGPPVHSNGTPAGAGEPATAPAR